MSQSSQSFQHIQVGARHKELHRLQLHHDLSLVQSLFPESPHPQGHNTLGMVLDFKDTFPSVIAFCFIFGANRSKASTASFTCAHGCRPAFAPSFAATFHLHFASA